MIGDAERDKGMRLLFLLEFVEVCAPFLLGLMVEFAEFLVDAAHLLAGCGEGREQEAWVFPKMLDIFFRVDVVMQVSWTEVDRPGDEVDEVLLHERVVRHGLAGIRERRLIECLAVGWGIFRQDACFLVELLQGLAGWLAERREILRAVGIEDFGWPIKVGDAVERELEAVVFPILVERPVLDDQRFPALLDREAFFPGILFCEEVVPRIAVRRDVGKVAEVIGVAHRDDAAFPAMRADEVASDEVLEGVEVPNGFFCDSLAALAECFPVYEFRCHVYSPLSSGMRMESFLGRSPYCIHSTGFHGQKSRRFLPKRGFLGRRRRALSRAVSTNCYRDDEREFHPSDSAEGSYNDLSYLMRPSRISRCRLFWKLISISPTVIPSNCCGKC